MSKRQYILIGSGVAAISAAQEIRKTDPLAEIHLISDEPDGYYSRPGLAYFVTGELSERQIFPFKEKDFQALELIRHTATVEAVDAQAHHVTLKQAPQQDSAAAPEAGAALRPPAAGNRFASAAPELPGFGRQRYFEIRYPK